MPPKDTTSYSTSSPSYYIWCLVLSHNPFRHRHLVYVPPETKTFIKLRLLLPHPVDVLSCFRDIRPLLCALSMLECFCLLPWVRPKFFFFK